MRAIITTYLDPVGARGARIMAKALGAPRMIVECSDSRRGDEDHDFAAVALCLKMRWPGDLVRGKRPDQLGNVYTFLLDDEIVRNPTLSYRDQARHERRRATGDAQ